MPGASGGVAASHVYSKVPDGNSWLFVGGYNRGLRAMGFSDLVPYLDWQYFGADSSLMSLSVKPDSPIKDILFPYPVTIKAIPTIDNNLYA